MEWDNGGYPYGDRVIMSTPFRRYRETVRELSQFSDYELCDIGHGEKLRAAAAFAGAPA